MAGLDPATQTHALRKLKAWFTGSRPVMEREHAFRAALAYEAAAGGWFRDKASRPVL